MAWASLLWALMLWPLWLIAGCQQLPVVIKRAVILAMPIIHTKTHRHQYVFFVLHLHTAALLLFTNIFVLVHFTSSEIDLTSPYSPPYCSWDPLLPPDWLHFFIFATPLLLSPSPAPWLTSLDLTSSYTGTDRSPHFLLIHRMTKWVSEWVSEWVSKRVAHVRAIHCERRCQARMHPHFNMCLLCTRRTVAAMCTLSCHLLLHSVVSRQSLQWACRVLQWGSDQATLHTTRNILIAKIDTRWKCYSN